MSMGRNGSSLAWMTTTADDEYVRYYFYGGYSLQDDDLYARVCKKGDVAYIRVDCSLENKLPPSDQEVKKAWMTTLLQKKNKMAELMVCLWEEMGLVWPG